MRKAPPIGESTIIVITIGIMSGLFIGKTVGIAGESLSFQEMSDKLSKGLGISPVQINAVDADLFRSFGFPGADEYGNMFQTYRDFEKEVNAARSVDETRKLNPQLQSFDQWLSKNKDKVAKGPNGSAGFDDVVMRIGAEFADVETDLRDEDVSEESGPIIQLANRIIEDAYFGGASDVHIEPMANKLRVRYRLDGVR